MGVMRYKPEDNVLVMLKDKLYGFNHRFPEILVL